MKEQLLGLIAENKQLPLYILRSEVYSSISKFEGLQLPSKAYQTDTFTARPNYKPTLLYASL